MTGNAPAVKRPSQWLLAALGLLWLIFAAAIVIMQLASPASIRIEWQTETELNTAGFNVYRSAAPGGEYVRLNEQLIPSRGSATSGSTYTVVDEDVAAGETYYYRLEDVELDNSRQLHEILSYTAPRAPWWVPVFAAISILCGLFLLIKGLR
jgi:hypothetical protein